MLGLLMSLHGAPFRAHGNVSHIGHLSPCNAHSYLQLKSIFVMFIISSAYLIWVQIEDIDTFVYVLRL